MRTWVTGKMTKSKSTANQLLLNNKAVTIRDMQVALMQEAESTCVGTQAKYTLQRNKEAVNRSSSANCRGSRYYILYQNKDEQFKS